MKASCCPVFLNRSSRIPSQDCHSSCKPSFSSVIWLQQTRRMRLSSHYITQLLSLAYNLTPATAIVCIHFLNTGLIFKSSINQYFSIKEIYNLCFTSHHLWHIIKRSLGGNAQSWKYMSNTHKTNRDVTRCWQTVAEAQQQHMQKLVSFPYFYKSPISKQCYGENRDGGAFRQMATFWKFPFTHYIEAFWPFRIKCCWVCLCLTWLHMSNSA